MIRLKLKNGESVLSISDLHLVDGTNADDFGNNDDDILKWIDKLCPSYVVIAGDFRDIWQAKQKNIDRIHKKLVDFTKSKIVYLIDGNHDYKLTGTDRMEIILPDGKRCLVIHGHQGDKNMKNPFIRFGVWLLAIVERLPLIGAKDADNPEKSKNPFVQKKHKKAVEITTEHAIKMLKKYDVVIQGHDHEIKIKTYKTGKVYCNCGTCIEGKFEGILYEDDKFNMVNGG